MTHAYTEGTREKLTITEFELTAPILESTTRLAAITAARTTPEAMAVMLHVWITLKKEECEYN